MNIRDNIKTFLLTVPPHVKLVAVSKTKPIEAIEEAYNAGQRIFGENKAQELAAKQAVLPRDIEWHFIGHMQTNKVKYIAPFVSLFHGVDSLKILKEFNKQGQNNNRVIHCLLQFHIAEEETKFGLDLEEARALLLSDAYSEMKHIRIVGVMGMATYTDDAHKIRREFHHLKKTFDEIKNHFFKSDNLFKEISMGMSGDYQIAIEEGSTMIRIGTALFGDR